MLVRPGQAVSVECVTQGEGSGPIRQILPERQAVRLALWALADR